MSLKPNSARKRPNRAVLVKNQESLIKSSQKHFLRHPDTSHPGTELSTSITSKTAPRSLIARNQKWLKIFLSYALLLLFPLQATSSQSSHIATLAIDKISESSFITSITFIPKTTVFGIASKDSKKFNIYKINPKTDKISTVTSFSHPTHVFSLSVAIPDKNYLLANTFNSEAFLYDYTQPTYVTRFTFATNPKKELDVVLGQSRMIIADQNQAFNIFDTTTGSLVLRKDIGSTCSTFAFIQFEDRLACGLQLTGNTAVVNTISGTFYTGLLALSQPGEKVLMVNYINATGMILVTGNRDSIEIFDWRRTPLSSSTNRVYRHVPSPTKRITSTFGESFKNIIGYSTQNSNSLSILDLEANSVVYQKVLGFDVNPQNSDLVYLNQVGMSYEHGYFVVADSMGQLIVTKDVEVTCDPDTSSFFAGECLRCSTEDDFSARFEGCSDSGLRTKFLRWGLNQTTESIEVKVDEMKEGEFKIDIGLAIHDFTFALPKRPIFENFNFKQKLGLKLRAAGIGSTQL